MPLGHFVFILMLISLQTSKKGCTATNVVYDELTFTAAIDIQAK